MNRHLSQRRRSNRWDARSAAGVLWLAIGLTQTLYGADLHVSPRGDDTQAGTPDRSQWLGAAASETSTVDYARAAHQPTGAVHQLDQWHQSFLPHRDPTAALIHHHDNPGWPDACQPAHLPAPQRVRGATARCMADGRHRHDVLKEPQFPEAPRAYQDRLFAAVKAGPQLGARPAVMTSSGDPAKAPRPGWLESSHFANTHCFASGDPPGSRRRRS